MSAISNNDIARAIYSASKDDIPAGQFYSKVISFLNRRRLLSKAPAILLSLNKIINDEEGKVVAKVSSKSRLGEKTKKELEHILSKRYSGKSVTLAENLDERLLGGFKIEVNDEVMDLTIKNKIGKLQEYLTKSV